MGIIIHEMLEDKPVVSTHNEFQVSPQEWDCGCITAAYVTDRNERPVEMRLYSFCNSDQCELVANRKNGAVVFCPVCGAEFGGMEFCPWDDHRLVPLARTNPMAVAFYRAIGVDIS